MTIAYFISRFLEISTTTQKSPSLLHNPYQIELRFLCKPEPKPSIHVTFNSIFSKSPKRSKRLVWYNLYIYMYMMYILDICT